MVAIRSAARRRQQTRTEIVTSTGFGEAMVERLGKSDPKVCAPSVEARFRGVPGASRRVSTLELPASAASRSLKAEKSRNRKCDRHLDHYHGELQ